MSPTFAQLGVPNSIVSALASRNIHQPFEIQAATIADALAGRDVCGRAPTGSGKTLAFGIPLVASVDRAEPKRPKALILAPTRELADQIHSDLRTFAGNVRIGVVYGGVGYQPQVNSLRRGVDILVACPGRLEDLIEQGLVSLNDVDRVVLDEADRMADMGFMPSVRRLLDQTAAERQTVLFSATLDGDVAKLTRDYQRDPVMHEVGDSTPDITAATHLFWNVTRADRVDVAATAIQASWPSIVFCRTRHGSDRVVKQLARSGVDAVAIHGGRSQAQRTRALSDFAKGRVQALVATDVASRGIHVDGVASVVHFDPPEDHKAYTHRSGRTARAGETGVVVSLVQPEQKRDLKRMQRAVGLDEPFTEPDAAAVASVSPTRTRPKPAKQASSRDTKSRRSSGDNPDRHRSTNRPQHSRSSEGRSSGTRSSDSRRSDNRSSGRRSGSSHRAGSYGNKSSRNGQRSGAPRRDAGHRAESRFDDEASEDTESNKPRRTAPSGRSRSGGRTSSGAPRGGARSGGQKKARTGGKGGAAGKGATGKARAGKGRHPASDNNGRPNRKARRAHLQKGTGSSNR